MSFIALIILGTIVIFIPLTIFHDKTSVLKQEAIGSAQIKLTIISSLAYLIALEMWFLLSFWHEEMTINEIIPPLYGFAEALTVLLLVLLSLKIAKPFKLSIYYKVWFTFPIVIAFIPALLSVLVENVRF